MPGKRVRTFALALSLTVVTMPLVLLRSTTIVAAKPSARATPKHKTSPSPSPTPTETSPSPSPSPTATATKSPSPTATDVQVEKPDGVDDLSPSPSPTEEEDDESEVWWKHRPKFEGSYSTDTLIALAERAAQFDSSRAVERAIYAPFIVMGPADFTDTWGSVRHSDGGKLRPHLGQDVFCERGAPVLATEAGSVEFVKDDLGGKVVRLHHDRGGYWYYAHLQGYPRGLDSGDRVSTGQVVGFCGSSGNASGTAPHVHFGSYPGPENPMGDLVDWLEDAEEGAERIVDALIDSGMEVRVAQRLFGEDLVPPAPDEVVREDPAQEPLELLLGQEFDRK